MVCSNVCQHPKEGKTEERAGFGGGFKENDNVQYRKHTEDDVYDEVREIFAAVWQQSAGTANIHGVAD